MRVTRVWMTLVSVATLALAACSTSAPGTGAASAEQPSPASPRPVTLGAFPEFPSGELSTAVTVSLQGVLDDAVATGQVRRAAAAVIVVGAGSWAGAAGVNAQAVRMAPADSIEIASVGKTITAAEILRLADEGKLALDDPPSEYLPSSLAGFALNDASIRDLLGMRTGFRDPPSYDVLVNAGYTTGQLLSLVPPPYARAGTTVEYSNINFVVLGEIIEHVTGKSMWEAVHGGVLAGPGLEGVTYPESSALAADGWRIEADPAALARWGYELYGGHVLSPVALNEMLDFSGEFYGLGAIDFTHPDASGQYDTPAVGHGGVGESFLVRLVVFPQTGTVVALQSDAGDLEGIASLAAALRDAATP
jgi:D-alanyl-D-alanine carboxypeptidase